MLLKPISLTDRQPPKAHYSPAIVYNGLVFVSGQLPLDDNGEARLGTIEETSANRLNLTPTPGTISPPRWRAGAICMTSAGSECHSPCKSCAMVTKAPSPRWIAPAAPRRATTQTTPWASKTPRHRAQWRWFGWRIRRGCGCATG